MAQLKKKSSPDSSENKRVFEKSSGISRAFSYTEDEREEDLRLASSLGRFGRELNDKDIKAFVEFGEKHGLSEDEFIVFCRYYDKGINPKDFDQLRHRDVAVRYGFSPSDAKGLLATRDELNKKHDFNKEITVYRIVQSIQTVNTQRKLVESGAEGPGTNEKKRRLRIMLDVDAVFRSHDKDGEAMKRIMASMKD